MHYVVQNVNDAGAVEGAAAGQHFVEQATCGEQIGRRAGNESFHLLGGHVMRCAEDHPGRCQGDGGAHVFHPLPHRRFHVPRQSEVQ